MSEFNYSILFNQALQRIKEVRDPHAGKPAPVNAEWDWYQIQQHALFNFGGRLHNNYASTIENAKNISISCLQAIICYLLKSYNIKFELIDDKIEQDDEFPILWAIMDSSSNTLLLFKEIEKCFYFKTDTEPDNIVALMKKHHASSCKYIYLMYDGAFHQIVDHNNDEEDPGRGYNVYSLSWFWRSYFGNEEYDSFMTNLLHFQEKVENYLGYIVLKSLTPNSLLNFKNIVANELSSFHYKDLETKVVNEFELQHDEYEKIRDQFLTKGNYLLMLGNHDYAESLITAEWLYKSMKAAQAVDLTAVGMGYFKSIEQLLYELICLDNPTALHSDSVNSTLGAMAIYYRDHLHILRDDLTYRTRKYIRESLFTYKDLRNGYLHKENIHSWEKIDIIRDKTFQLIFLILGAQKLNCANLDALGIPEKSYYDDFSKLCEYINYHSQDIFFLCDEHGCNIGIYNAHVDRHTEIVDDLYIRYSGVYLSLLGSDRTIRFSRDNMPPNVYLGKYILKNDGNIHIIPVKAKKILENGVFVGPSLIEENGLDY